MLQCFPLLFDLFLMISHCHLGGRPAGKTRPLKPEKPRWKSDIPLTQGQLRSKRDEFWDTAPAFEGETTMMMMILILIMMKLIVMIMKLMVTMIW